jgi:hypothetical protein
MYLFNLAINFMKSTCFCLLLLLFSCKAQNYPPRHSAVSEKKYEQYCTMLKKAKDENDYFYQSLALCNLRQSPQQVYKLLHKSIKQHDTLCYQIHDYQNMHKNGKLTVSFIKADTMRWKKLCAECEKIVPIEQYSIKQSEKELAYKKKKAIAESKLDTNRIDKKLVTTLKDIFAKDQAIRSIPFLEKKDTRWQQQKTLDSLNLIQIDSIFKKENGYPNIEKVGYDPISIPWYILHHQSSAIIRHQYQSFIVEAVQKGYLNKSMLDTYNERTRTIEENEKPK